MAQNEQEIIKDIEKHFAGKANKDCYVGVTANAKHRLFVDHNVSEENGHWIYRTASSDTVARRIEQHFIDAGMDGAPGGGDETANKVYAYKKTSSTNP